MRRAVRPPSRAAVSSRFCARLLIVEPLPSGRRTPAVPARRVIYRTFPIPFGRAWAAPGTGPGRGDPAGEGLAPVADRGILDMFRLDDKVAIVTGASSGLG